MKTYGTTPAFAHAKPRTTLAATEARSADATRKIDRVFGASTGRSIRTSTFSSAL
ncbi:MULTISPECIES: FXSXX-COOH protein [unclassified Streptomyces]|uniref:FXSXX-COOH protein n=1 Tax=unclassified Streptomyces TaxID=2593676 RepID=UPI00344C40B4